MYQNVKWTDQEQYFIDSFMDDSIHPQSAIFFHLVKDFVAKRIVERANMTQMVTEASVKLCENILYKIQSAEADQAIEDILNGVTTGTATKAFVKRAVKTHRTSRMSLDEFMLVHGAEVGGLVLKTIQDNPSISRRELADKTGLRLSTICGTVNKLYKEDLVRVAGVKLDTDSNRKVEVLEVR